MIAFRERSACAFLVCALLMSGCGDGVSPSPQRVGDALVLAITCDSPPYTSLDESGEPRGIDVDIARAAAAKLGRKLEIRTIDPEELIPQTKSGVVDMAASGLAITAGRLRSVDFSIPYAEDGGAFLYRAGERAPTVILAESIRVATIESMTHDFYLTRHGIDPVRYRSFADAVQDVENKKVDAMYYDRSSLADVAEKSGGRLAVTPLVTRERLGIVVRKGFKELKAALDAVIEERKSR